MNVGIIGAGGIGAAIAKRLASRGNARQCYRMI
jgi:predicted dinucleotide-binding enzyme